MADLTHHVDIWYDDGNVVLVAGTMAFCVHRSILSRKCTVFRDMEKASHPDDEDMIDGRPVVRLHDDPQDLAHFLQYLYNGVL